MAGSAEPLACPGRCAGPAGTDTVDIGTMPDAVFPRTTFSADSASARGTPGRALLRSCLGSASYRGPLDHVLQLVVVRVEQGFDPGGLRATLACSETCESVGTAAQWCSLIFPITRKRGSSSVFAGPSSIRASFQSTWASSKSMPCLALFVALFAGSCSNSMGYLVYIKILLL